jgi:hypothetical protein
MARSEIDHSTALFHGGIKGLIYGAIIGGVLALVFASVLDRVMDWGSGGAVLHAMGGAAAGGLIGWFAGILVWRRTGVGARG